MFVLHLSWDSGGIGKGRSSRQPTSRPRLTPGARPRPGGGSLLDRPGRRIGGRPPSASLHASPIMSPYPRDLERTMRAFYRSLRENDRRRYAAVEAAKLGHGGVEYISQVLGIDPKTIRQGQRDLEDLPEDPTSRVRNPGGGRKRKIDDDPKIDEDFRKVLVEHTAGSPAEESLIWTNLTKTEIVDLMQTCGSYVSVHIIDQLLDRHDY